MDIFWLIFLFAIGACVGSFVNVVIYRLPRGESVIFPPSHCPSCGRWIRSYDNVPIISWLMLHGRCRSCKTAISRRYLVVESVTAVLVAGLYACYYIADIRDGAGELGQSWPMFAAHAALLCGLLGASIVDVEHWIIPLEIMWACSAIGIAAAAFRPHSFMPQVSPDLVGMSLAALGGLVVAIVLLRVGLIQPSFIDAHDRPTDDDGPADGASDRPTSVAFTSAHGVNPRKEVLRELLFLAPPLIAAIAAGCVLHSVPSVGETWRNLLDVDRHPKLAPHILAGGAAIFGYFVGASWIWGMRILGTLAFGTEAMGLGDVHILGAVGAVTGWIVPSLAFFLAPFFGLSWALYLWAGRRQRELPYGPWLAGASVIVMLFYDRIASFVGPYAQTMAIAFNGWTGQ